MLDAQKVQSVYSGRPGCCCGCRGKHYYPRSQSALAEKRGGTVSDTMVTKVVNLINAQPATLLDDGGSYVAFETETRLYIAYRLDEPTTGN